MLEVTVNINREKIVAQLHAVRTKPKGCKIEDGTMCTYNIVYKNEIVGEIEGPYGCGIDLAIELLKKFKKDEYFYKTIVMFKILEETEKDSFD